MTRFPAAARALQLLSIFGVLFVLLQPCIALSAAVLGTETLDLGVIRFRVGEDMTLWKALLIMVPNGIVAIGLWQLSRFGGLLATGGRFSKAVSSSLKTASILFVVGVMMSWIIEPFRTNASFAEALLQLIENHGLLLLISLAFSLVAVLLQEAQEIDDENKEFY